MRNVFQIDPLTDPRWPAFLEGHPRASVFHSVQWLQALQRTYGYSPVVFTTCLPATALENGYAFCEVQSWLTGRRLVSLPFSDHCDPLVDSDDDLHDIARALYVQRERRKWDYVELRPTQLWPDGLPGFDLYQPFYLHKLDLRPSLDQIFGTLNKSSTQRKIRRAERDGLEYEAGGSESLIDRFYNLLRYTRQRHGLPPQPRKWFSNLFDLFRSQATIHLASLEGKAVGSTFTLRFKKSLVLKYVCGDPEYFKHGTMQFLYWRAIQDAKARGLEDLDFGRSDDGDVGLVVYKERCGAARSQSGYFRSPRIHLGHHLVSPSLRPGSTITANVPQAMLNVAGRLLYRHFG